MRSRTARVMTTLMRNGRDRRSENPLMGQARKERVLLVGTDQRITSGPAATAAASREAKPPSENRPYTWLHPNASQKVRFFSLAPRAPSIHDPYLPSAAYFCCDAAQHSLNATGHLGAGLKFQHFDRPLLAHEPCTSDHGRPFLNLGLNELLKIFRRSAFWRDHVSTNFLQTLLHGRGFYGRDRCVMKLLHDLSGRVLSVRLKTS